MMDEEIFIPLSGIESIEVTDKYSNTGRYVKARSPVMLVIAFRDATSGRDDEVCFMTGKSEEWKRAIEETKASMNFGSF